jgi:hypothetical protein
LGGLGTPRWNAIRYFYVIFDLRAIGRNQGNLFQTYFDRLRNATGRQRGWASGVTT